MNNFFLLAAAPTVPTTSFSLGLKPAVSAAPATSTAVSTAAVTARCGIENNSAIITDTCGVMSVSNSKGFDEHSLIRYSILNFVHLFLKYLTVSIQCCTSDVICPAGVLDQQVELRVGGPRETLPTTGHSGQCLGPHAGGEWREGSLLHIIC